MHYTQYVELCVVICARGQPNQFSPAAVRPISPTVSNTVYSCTVGACSKPDWLWIPTADMPYLAAVENCDIGGAEETLIVTLFKKL